jgi:glycosyltransferase involved in cell wall biosynthesis
MIYLIFIVLSCFAEAKSPKIREQKICLNMIVKNESSVIQRCLESVKPVIDYWVIVDTGSTDGTQQVICECMGAIPGELYQRPWRNFGENRSEALDLAKGKGDYILFMDADDTLEFAGEMKWPPLTKDLYLFWRGGKDFGYLKPQLVRGNFPWRWIGVTHEYLETSRRYTSAILPGVNYKSSDGGARSRDPEKYWKNVHLLLEGIQKEPHNLRYMFYLAESYRDAGDKEKALEWYRKRIEAGGWEEEIFCSKLQIGHLLRQLGRPRPFVIEAYKQAYNYRPHRVEPIYYLAALYNLEKRYEEAYTLLKAAQSVHQPLTPDLLFHERWIFRYGLLFQLALSAHYLGREQESHDLCSQLLAIPDLPEQWRKILVK